MDTKWVKLIYREFTGREQHGDRIWEVATPVSAVAYPPTHAAYGELKASLSVSRHKVWK